MGNYVIIDYGSGITVRAMHMYQGTIEVNVGDTVEAGQVLGKIGSSGQSTGTHLHIDMTINGTWVDVAQHILDDTNSGGTAIKDIAEDKIFYIGDSWIELLKSSGKAKSPGSYFYGKSGMNADWVISTYSSMKIPDDASCIVVKFGLNGPTLWKKTQELVDKLAKDYSNKEIFVLQSPHVCKEYNYNNTLSGDDLNKQVDNYNKQMENYCNNKNGVTFINPTTNIVDKDGKGYLKKEYAEGTFHLNSSGNKVWYDDIIKCIKSTIKVNDTAVNNVDMSANIVKIDDKNRSGYKINLDLDKEVEEMLQKVKKLGFNIEGYIDSQNKNECLKNIIKACIVTQYPDLRSAKDIANDKKGEKIPEDETQGCIKIKRYANEATIEFAPKSLVNPSDEEKDGGGMYLEYMPYNDLTKLINNNDKKALNYFSMDSSNNIVVAGWETMNVSVNIQQDNISEVGECPTSVYGEVQYTQKAKNYEKLTTKSINYLDQVSNYTLQFSLFWSLLVYGHDQDFINDFAKLVINTDIVLGCYDAVTTTTTKYTSEDTKQGTPTIDNYAQVESSQRPFDSGKIGETVEPDPVKYHFTITEIDVLKTDNPTLKLKYADIWTAVYNKDYITDIKESEEKGDKVKLDDVKIGTKFYQKVYKEDGTADYTGNNRPEDENLLKIIDTIIDESYEKNIKILEEAAENKNKSLEYRYNNLNKYYLENRIVVEENGDIYKFLTLKEVQNQVINCVLNMSNDKTIEKIFEPGVNQADGFSNEFKSMLVCAEKINKNNSFGILTSANNIVKNLINDHVRNNGGTDSELYKSLTKNGSDTKTNYTASSMSSSQIKIEYKDTDRTEEYEKNIEEEKIKEVPKNDNLRWKDNKNAKENSFVKLLAHSISAKGNLRVVKEWFFDSLEETEAIADMEDLLKYLFQKVYGTDYGITDKDADKLLEMFDPMKMKSFNKKSTSGGTIVGGASYSSIKISDEDMQVFYKLIEAEGGGGTHEQMMYLACVVLNRILSSAFDVSTVSEVANAPGQFEVMWNGMYDSAIPSPETIAAVDDAIKTGDITGGGIGFANDWLYDEGGMTAEPSIELFRETWPFGGVVVIFTTASIQAELAQYK